LNLLYQDNVGNKADLVKHQENIEDAEETQNVPASQRSSRKATVDVIGSMTSLQDVLGLMANILHLIITLVKLVGCSPKPIIYAIITYLFNFCSSNHFQLWAIKNKHLHPFLHVYLFQVIEHIWMAFARTAAAPSNRALAIR
jgi:hypothetical protein